MGESGIFMRKIGETGDGVGVSGTFMRNIGETGDGMGGIRVPCGEFQLERGPPDLTDNPPAPELCNGESIGGQLGAGKQENR